MPQNLDLFPIGNCAVNAPIDRDGRFADVTNSPANSVSVLDVKELRDTKTVAVGKSPNGISITP